MTVLAVVTRQARKGIGDVVEQSGCLGGIPGGPDDEHEHGGPRDELPGETTVLVVIAATSHFGFLHSVSW